MAVRRKMAFLNGVDLTKRDRATLEKQMSNWQICRKFMRGRKLTEALLAKMITFECERDSPRESMLRNITQRYNSIRRLNIEAQLDKFLSHPTVARTVMRGEREQA